MQLANVQYMIVMTQVAGDNNSSSNQTLALVNFGFERTDPVTGAVTFSYAGFDQDTYETALHAMLNAICGTWAANLGVTVAAVQAGMTVNRQWTFGSADMLGSTSPTVQMTDTMTYP